MLRTVLSFVVAAAFTLSAMAADEKKPDPKKEQPKAEAKQVKQPESPQMKRIAAMKEQIAAMRTKQQEAANEARKLREQANGAEGKAAGLKRDLEMMEKGMVEAMARAEVDAKEAAVKKTAFEKGQADAAKFAEMAKKLHEMDRQVRELSLKVEQLSPKKPGQAAKGACPVDKKPAEKKQEKPIEKKPGEKKDAPKAEKAPEVKK